MRQYLGLVQKVMDEGVMKENRTGVDALTITDARFEHDMSKGFPLLTTKYVPFGLVASELEFFIGGKTDKKWLQDRNNHIWDDWCAPEKVPYGHDKKTKKRIREERDLGPIYGFQWRHAGAEYLGHDFDYTGRGIDQLKSFMNDLKTNPNDRRITVDAWNVSDLSKMALPPCHYRFTAVVMGDKLDLIWNQRSVDTMVGLPFNIAEYGILLHIVARETGFKPGKLVGKLENVHIYENHFEGVREQLKRKPYKLPTIETKNFNSIFDWKYPDSEIMDYKHHSKISYIINV